MSASTVFLLAITAFCVLCAVLQPKLSRIGERRLRRDEAKLERHFADVQAGLLARVYGGCNCIEGIETNFEHHEPGCTTEIEAWTALLQNSSLRDRDHLRNQAREALGFPYDTDVDA